MSAISNITTIVNNRMTEALERLMNKIMKTLPEEVAEEFGEINISSFVKKAMKGFEEDLRSELTENELAEKKSTKKNSPKKDPNAPKGAKNAYILFCAENREQVKEENSEMNPKELISELARLWKEVDEDIKAKYQQKAAEDKQRYKEEMDDYVPSDEEASPKEKKKGSPKKDPNAPKGAKNAYILFCADNRDQVKEENPHMKSTEIISELARLWKEADDEVKAEYQEKAAEDKQRYKQEMEEYSDGEEKEEKEEKSPKKTSKEEKSPKKTSKKEEEKSPKKTSKEEEKSPKKTSKKEEKSPKKTSKKEEKTSKK